MSAKPAARYLDNRLVAVMLFLYLVFLTHSAAYSEDDTLRLATTTSTDNSGLLDILLPAFEQYSGIRVQVIAVGTGRALKYGEAGDVDCVLVHAKSAEERFVEAGYGIDRTRIMYNDFVLVGPVEDPAQVSGANTAIEAFGRIAAFGQDHSVRFVSRGDDSGTHMKELSLWRQSMDLPTAKWYLEAGQGMAQVLVIASEKDAYTLADRGTYIAIKNRINLLILFEGDPVLHNPYSAIAVNPDAKPRINYRAASVFISWLTSPVGQEMIANFKMNGEQLFHPNAQAGR